jgi:hypothetical protein
MITEHTMKKHTWIFLIHIALIAMAACDRSTPVANDEPFDIALHMQLIEENVIIPVRNRITAENLADLRMLTEVEAKDLSAAEGKRLTQIMETVMLPSERAYLTSVVHSIMDAHPEIKEMNVQELRSFFEASLPPGGGKGSVDTILCDAAASAAFKIVAIEATWITAMLACAATTIGYALCAGLATTAKYAALAVVMIEVAHCE